MVSQNSVLQHFNKSLTLACLLIAVSTFNYGFDNAGFNTTQAMDGFQRQFGRLNSTTGKYFLPPSWLSLFNSLNYIGFGVGVIVGSLVSGGYGRRMCMFTMSCYALITATIAVTSTTREQILAARVLNYVYIGMELAVVPVFQSEIVPAPVRGLAVGSYQFSLMSPRWLLTKDRVEEARDAFYKFRSGCVSDEEIAAEFEALQLALRLEPEQGKYMELFQGVNKRRTAIVVAMNFFQQATGQAFASTYGTIFIKGLGTINPFNMSIVMSVVNLTLVTTGLFLNDRIGRRPLLFIGAGIQIAAILTMGGLGTVSNPTDQHKIAIVAMLVVFSAGFVFAWAPLTYVITTEVSALRLRGASQRTASMVNVIMNFAVNFSLPYLLYAPYAALGSKVGFIFGAIAVCAVIFTFFCVPECKGRTLEQVDRMFNEGVPLRQFGDHQIVDPSEEASLEKTDMGVEVKAVEKI
ncbi:related to RGT2-Sensor of high external glucose concentrations [Rhynchosporium secalis]|uniref:Related to RGT2-Sensor of high external glucose concentrations n=1 Tax=Rhynchosporium secalis TaxID=38038 RepID=A0A1E1MC03_RHYSE|nr:related to RGT2-Sensor of high external glucose concentrations [Rhynchosporium secalis]